MSILQNFQGCFSPSSFQNFKALLVGWIFCIGRRSVSGAIRGARTLGFRSHHSILYAFFSRARWSVDAVGKVLFELLLPLLDDRIFAVVDDTLCHKTGPKIFGAGMHFDGSKSSYQHGSPSRGTFISYGHSWVKLAVWLPMPFGVKRGFAIPVLFRLYRSKKLCPAAEYVKRTELAGKLLELFIGWLPAGRELTVLGDGEYACGTVVRRLPRKVTFVGPVVKDAALYARPDHVPGKRGRKPIRGEKLPSPSALANDDTHPWETLTANIYGRQVRLQTKTVRCLWYTVAKDRLVTVVLTRDPRHILADRVFFSTDATAGPAEVLESYARRWELEVCFRAIKQSMGLEDPQNGWWREDVVKTPKKKRPGPNPHPTKGRQAVSRTAPLACLAYSIVVIWFLRDRRHLSAAIRRPRIESPWYAHKSTPCFSDMVAGLRRQIWAERISATPGCSRDQRKLLDLLPHWLLAA